MSQRSRDRVWGDGSKDREQDPRKKSNERAPGKAWGWWVE